MAKETSEMKIDHNKVSRVWREGGPRINNVRIKTLYDTGNKMVTLQFEDEFGPVFRATFNVPDLRKLLDDINDSLLQIDLDEDRAAEKMSG